MKKWNEMTDEERKTFMENVKIIEYEHVIRNELMGGILKNIDDIKKRSDDFYKLVTENKKISRTSMELTELDIEIIDRLGKNLGNTRVKRLRKLLHILELVVENEYLDIEKIKGDL